MWADSRRRLQRNRFGLFGRTVVEEVFRYRKTAALETQQFSRANPRKRLLHQPFQPDIRLTGVPGGYLKD